MQAFPRARMLLALAFVTTLTGVFAVGTSTAATAQELGKTMTTPSGFGTRRRCDSSRSFIRLDMAI